METITKRLKGGTFQISAADLHLIAGRNLSWLHGRVVVELGNGDKEYLDRLVKKCWNNQVVRHRDGDMTNCTRGNIDRKTKSPIVSYGAPPPTRIRYHGVTKCGERWKAAINHKGTMVVIGRFDNQMEAARKYDKYALKLFGPSAHLNFPEEAIFASETRSKPDGQTQAAPQEKARAALPGYRQPVQREDISAMSLR